MLKRTITSLAVGLMVFIGVTAFAPAPAPPEADCGCPPGWELKCDVSGVGFNKSKDVNDDNCLCRKAIPGKKANGNNQGTVDARNWKDNNQPCDD